ncbi:MAG: saccharopine dehydrogenase NADP-binding domain-containing protein [Myxococcales bacterium]|nr:saccharopine dehydrogenase NADP-binding domain-containing protein [Myxococcales bacterium]
MTDHREFDIILWGASGFTGRLVAEYLFGRYGAGGDPRWAMGGRNAKKIEEIRRDLGPGAAEIPIVVGDSHDPESLSAMVARARVICTTVGPYAKYGSELVAACARSGTDYCDLAGETPWIRRMIDAHGEEAIASGARIVPCSGFDSVPSDLGVWRVQSEARERTGAACGEVKLRVKAMRGGASGGTVASMLNIVEEVRRDRSVLKILNDPYALCPVDLRHGPEQVTNVTPQFDADVGAWVGPFVMAAINTRIVHRTNALLGQAYGADFRYSEAVMTGTGLAGRAKAIGLAAGMGGFMAAAAIRPLRALLERFVLPEPGEGPSASAREAGFYDILVIGRTADGATIRGRVRGDRDPGYGSTSKMLGEAAVCLAKDCPKETLGGGFWTPASAMGAKLMARLSENAGVTFEIEGT